ncbi:hypothetical protein LTR84_001641 [Exophiala bonariae]|uniref:Uncharacterized protein n=1 Tax=Exophiala bonariae TaxID=1690606 RepID=A0AAV9NAV6_9EURO|nr:hypothetical protein LTR84_001641 [Exophiala bonariae]
MCHQSQNASLRLDTGYLDSHFDLGLNAPSKDRILLRRVTNCQGYYIYDWVFEAGTQPQPDVWIPLPQLTRPDADLSLFSLSSNNIQYLGPIDDPFFSAHKMLQSDDMTSWKADGPEEFVHFMACTDQHQFCIPQAKNFRRPEICTQLSGYIPLCGSLNAFPFNKMQLATAERICSQLSFALMDEAVSGLGPSALLAVEHVVTLISDSLPIDHWMREVSYWFAISLSRVQRGLIQYAAGPAEIPHGMSVVPPSDEAGRQLCKAQKIRANGGYQSYSVLGLCIILVFGVAIILTSWVLEPITNFLRKNYLNDRKRRRIQWLLDGKLQMLRMAYEYAGVGDWIKKDEETPVVQNLNKIFVFPVNPNASDPGWREPCPIQDAVVPLSDGQQNTTPETKPLISSHTTTDEGNR